MGDGALHNVRVDPDYAGGNDGISEANDFVKAMLTGYLSIEFAQRPDLLPHVVPDYPPGAKRMLRDNGVWAGALTRDDVRLITDGIREITPAGVVTADGEEHAVDVLIYGTGFQASKFLTPMQVTGRDGTDLHEMWAGDARAYLGITVPGFPNLFCLYGPNTNIVVNGSIIYFSECEVHFVVGCIRRLLETGAAAIDTKRSVHDAYNERIDAANLRMAWGVSKVNSWYKNVTGRTAQNWPFSALEYWRRTHALDPAEYEFL